MDLTMSSIGKKVRLNRLFDKKTNTSVNIALDHAISWGVLPGIEKIGNVIDEMADEGIDAFTILKGTAMRNYSKHLGKIPFILKATSFSPHHPTYDTPIATVEEALKLGADAISVGTTVGGEEQSVLIKKLAEVVRVADGYGMPTVTHIYPKGEFISEEDRFNVDNVKYAARIASELGVDIIKTFYTGDKETFEEVVEAAGPARVVISGGPKASGLQEFFAMTRDGIDAGAKGVTYGRNIWQSKDSKKILNITKKIVRNNLTVEEALNLMGSKEND